MNLMTPPDMDIEQAADSTAAKASARILMPVLVAVLTIAMSIIAFFVVRLVNTFDAGMAEVRSGQRDLGEKFTAVDKKVSLMSQRVDEMLIRQVDQNTETLKEHDARLERLERVVPLP